MTAETSFIFSAEPHLEASHPWVNEALFEEIAHEELAAGAVLPEAVPILLSAGEPLFSEGEHKSHIYRLEAGLVCLSAIRASGPPQIVEFVRPGQFLGLGFLKRHIHNAKAVVGCSLSCWPLSTLQLWVEQDPIALDCQANAIEREFAHRRRVLSGLTKNQPEHRLAAFLVAMSRLSEVEGRDPDAVSDSLNCGVVATYLGIDIDALARALTSLQSQGLVKSGSQGQLMLCDRDKLEELYPSP